MHCLISLFSKILASCLIKSNYLTYTIRLYRGMEGKIPDEPAADYGRIPLIDLPPTIDPNAPPGESGEEMEAPKSPAADENKSTTSKSGMGKKSKGSQEDIVEKKK